MTDKKELLQIFGTKVRALRTARGMSQTELGNMVGFSAPRSSVSQIECGQNDLPLSKVEQMADALGVSPAVFFTPCDVEIAYQKADAGTQKSVRKLLDLPEKGDTGLISTGQAKKSS